MTSATAKAAAGVFGLPSLRTLDAGSSLRIWLCTQRTDMRCGFDRLAALAQQVTGQDPLSGHLFVFRNRTGDRLKLLHWDRDGYLLWYKRLEEGVFKFPRSAANGAAARWHRSVEREAEQAVSPRDVHTSVNRRTELRSRGADGLR